ncbi:MAG: hypothetical protein LBQ30_04915, partial [Treponema sp.]|nr:hypothetical protein [Treponema sp.]
MKTSAKPTPLISYALLILAAFFTLTSCGPTVFSNPDDPIPLDQGLVQIRLPSMDNRSLNSTQTQGYTDYYEVIFKEKDADRYYPGTGRTGDTVTLQVPGNTTYEILILGGYEYESRHILLGSVFANKLDGEEARYEQNAAGIRIDGGTRTMLSFKLDPLLLELTEDYTVAFSFAGVPLGTNGKPERINERLATIADTAAPLKAQQEPEQLSVTVTLNKVPSLMRAETGTTMRFAEVQGRLEVYDPAAGRFIYYTPMKSRGPWYPTADEELALEFTVPTTTIQKITPADGDWKFDFEATYYGFGDPTFGGTKWIIRNG